MAEAAPINKTEEPKGLVNNRNLLVCPKTQKKTGLLGSFFYFNTFVLHF